MKIKDTVTLDQEAVGLRADIENSSVSERSCEQLPMSSTTQQDRTDTDQSGGPQPRKRAPFERPVIHYPQADQDRTEGLEGRKSKGEEGQKLNAKAEEDSHNLALVLAEMVAGNSSSSDARSTDQMKDMIKAKLMEYSQDCTTKPIESRKEPWRPDDPNESFPCHYCPEVKDSASKLK